jgi:hypothetical protein
VAGSPWGARLARRRDPARGRRNQREVIECPRSVRVQPRPAREKLLHGGVAKWLRRRSAKRPSPARLSADFRATLFTPATCERTGVSLVSPGDGNAHRSAVGWHTKWHMSPMAAFMVESTVSLER